MIDTEHLLTRWVRFWWGICIVKVTRRTDLYRPVSDSMKRRVHETFAYLPNWILDLFLHRWIREHSYYRPGHPKHPPRPAEMLSGMELVGKDGTVWKVGERVD